jgi:hypothetical protein
MKGPLWMPYGSVRALLAIALVFVACVGFMLDKVSGEGFVSLASAVVAFYFGTKAAEASKP